MLLDGEPSFTQMKMEQRRRPTSSCRTTTTTSPSEATSEQVEAAPTARDWRHVLHPVVTEGVRWSCLVATAPSRRS